MDTAVHKHLKNLLSDLIEELGNVLDVDKGMQDSDWPVIIGYKDQEQDRNLKQAPLTHLQEQFRVFLDRLEEEMSRNSIEDLMKTDSTEIIKKFIPKPNLFKNVEMVTQAISVGCIKLSVESVAEFMTSKYNFQKQPSEKYIRGKCRCFYLIMAQI